MFERFTEQARRTVFFARFEASEFGSPSIEVEHLLLALIRESPYVRQLLPSGSAHTLSERMRSEYGVSEKFSTSVDIPVSMEARHMLALGAEEARHPGNEIDMSHLFAGLLQVTPSLGHTFLREQLGDLEQLLLDVRRHLAEEALRPTPSAQRPSPALSKFPFELPFIPADEFKMLCGTLLSLLRSSFESMDCVSEAIGNAKLKRLPYTRKQALGNLIDWAAQYRLWVARAVTEPLLRADRFPSEESTLAQRYDQMRWSFVVDSWFFANATLLHVIAALPGSKASLPCRIGVEESVPLLQLIGRFVALTEDTLEQVLARLNTHGAS